MNRNLVIGVVSNYTYDQLTPFTRSLSRTTFDGDVVLLWTALNPATRSALQADGVKLFPIRYRGSGALNSWSRFWPVVSRVLRHLNSTSLAYRMILKAVLPLQTARFFHYHDYVSRHAASYSAVFLTDVRDVLFQSDPFSAFRGGLRVFQEPYPPSLADETACNASWVTSLFGKSVLEAIGHHPILCSGTIMGTTEHVLSYLHTFESVFKTVRTVSIGGSDQGIHNYICRKLLPTYVDICPNSNGHILTMGPRLQEHRDFTVCEHGLIRTRSGVPFPVLHQYDRHPSLAVRLLDSVHRSA